MSNKYATPFMLFILLVSMSAGCRQVGESKIIYLAHTLPITHPVHRGIEVFAREVSERSKGLLEVKIFPDGQLGTEREVLELLQIGSIAMTKVSAATMSNFAPEYEVMGVPYLFRDKDHLFSILDGEIGKRILNASEAYLLKGLCFYDAGSRSFYTKTNPIKSPEDLAGMKIRVMNHQMSVDMVNAMGGSATPMAYGELYTALQQGVVDGAENNPPSFVTSRHYEVCKYYTLDEHSSIPDVLVMGSKFWETLNDQDQRWLKEAAQVSVERQREFWAQNVEECMEILADANVEIIRPEKPEFADKTKTVLEEFAKNPEMRELVKAIQAHSN